MTPDDTITALIEAGFIREVEKDGQNVWTLSAEGMYAAAILYHMLSDEAKQTMPDLNFGGNR